MLVVGLGERAETLVTMLDEPEFRREPAPCGLLPGSLRTHPASRSPFAPVACGLSLCVPPSEASLPDLIFAAGSGSEADHLYRVQRGILGEGNVAFLLTDLLHALQLLERLASWERRLLAVPFELGQPGTRVLARGGWDRGRLLPRHVPPYERVGDVDEAP